MLKRAWAIPFVLVLGVLAAGEVWVSHMRVTVAQNTDKLKKEKIIVEQEVQELSLEFASLKRPDTLRRLAREKLGMHAPHPMQVVKPW